MSKQLKIAQKFNTIIKQLLEDTKSITGPSYSFNFNLITTFSKEMPIKTFCKYGLQYKNKILERDADFFLNTDLFQNEVDGWEDSTEDKQFYLNEFLNLKEIFNAIDENSRDNLWDILEALIILSEKYQKN